jgi:hypothetical protein
MWNKTSHDFGDQPEGQILSADFIYQGDKKIRNIEPSCSCTTWRQNNDVLTILWKTKTKKRDRDISTDLTIEYTDGSIDILELKAHVIINNT